MSHPEFKVKVTLEATLSPSEDPGKVAEALRNVIGGAQEEAAMDGGVRLTTKDVKAVSHIRNQLRDRHVRSAARRQLLLNNTGRTTFMMLNRQAAAAGVIAVCGSAEESPLGPIYANFESANMAAFIDWLTAYEEG